MDSAINRLSNQSSIEPTIKPASNHVTIDQAIKQSSYRSGNPTIKIITAPVRRSISTHIYPRRSMSSAPPPPSPGPPFLAAPFFSHSRSRSPRILPRGFILLPLPFTLHRRPPSRLRLRRRRGRRQAIVPRRGLGPLRGF